MLKIFSYYYPVSTFKQTVFDAVVLFSLLVFATVFCSDAIPAVDDYAVIGRIVVASALLFVLAVTTFNSVMGVYRQSAVSAVRSVLVPIILVLPVAVVLSLILPWPSFFTLAAPVALSVVMLMRGVYNRNPLHTLFPAQVLILGTGEEAQSVYDVLMSSACSRVEVVGFYPVNDSEEIKLKERSKVLPKGDIKQLVHDHGVSEIVIAEHRCQEDVLLQDELLDCRLMGVKITESSPLFERIQGLIRLDFLQVNWLICSDGFRYSLGRRFIKRCCDLIITLFLLLLALPVMSITALLIFLEDRGPVFYRQERVGLDNKIFQVIKFRSMRVDAEKDGLPRWASSNDDRVTRVGVVIRKLRIDELPQFFNVLAGDMSLVGPRPERPFFVDQLSAKIPLYSIRHYVKPGVTGWAQVRYQYGASVDDAVQKLQYDLYYVKNQSLLLDMMVLLETVRVVLTGEGAH